MLPFTAAEMTEAHYDLLQDVDFGEISVTWGGEQVSYLAHGGAVPQLHQQMLAALRAGGALTFGSSLKVELTSHGRQLLAGKETTNA